jgi:hypothetical protein
MASVTPLQLGCHSHVCEKSLDSGTIKYNHNTTGFREHNLQVKLLVDLEILNLNKNTRRR